MRNKISLGWRRSCVRRISVGIALPLLWCALLLAGPRVRAQKPMVVFPRDSIPTILLSEVILISSHSRGLEHHAQPNPLSLLDRYLEDSKKVSMIKRGAYGWEPMLHDMASERLSITLDGMKIFGACTDKMDPITSYVDVSNLSAVHVQSGQEGARQGSTIGGAVDLRTQRGTFGPLGWKGSLESGFESNNSAMVLGGTIGHSTEDFHLDTDIIYRKAENYRVGGGEELEHSQYEKFNLSANAGYRISEGDHLRASFIFDRARDVGYPALPMDVSLARAYIGSLSWGRAQGFGELKNWESKLYANTVAHIMDDSQRPEVPIRMDMPGASDTYGFYSQANLQKGDHVLFGKVDGHYNRSRAEMTMFPDDPEQPAMFMLTWPDVRSLAMGLYLEDRIALGEGSLKLSTRLELQTSHVADPLGLGSLKIFHPGMEARQERFPKSFSTRYQRTLGSFRLGAGLGYGERGPSVSEGFGFYLFNSFDRYDYIGDPELENEKSLEADFSLSLGLRTLDLQLEGHYFHIMDHIVGEHDPTLGAMTIGADGVKVYTNLDYAELYTIALEVDQEILPGFQWHAGASLHRGRDGTGRNLPMVSPLAYRGGLSYVQDDLSADFSMTGNGKQRHFSPDFGEDPSPGYTVFSASLGKELNFGPDRVYLKVGLENILDRKYSTYTDWNNIDRMGRNFHMSLSYVFDQNKNYD